MIQCNWTMCSKQYSLYFYICCNLAERSSIWWRQLASCYSDCWCPLQFSIVCVCVSFLKRALPLQHTCLVGSFIHLATQFFGSWTSCPIVQSSLSMIFLRFRCLILAHRRLVRPHLKECYIMIVNVIFSIQQKFIDFPKEKVSIENRRLNSIHHTLGPLHTQD